LTHTTPQRRAFQQLCILRGVLLAAASRGARQNAAPLRTPLATRARRAALAPDTACHAAARSAQRQKVHLAIERHIGLLWPQKKGLGRAAPRLLFSLLSKMHALNAACAATCRPLASRRGGVRRASPAAAAAVASSTPLAARSAALAGAALPAPAARAVTRRGSAPVRAAIAERACPAACTSRAARRDA
jgi:hypothetical protein